MPTHSDSRPPSDAPTRPSCPPDFDRVASWIDAADDDAATAGSAAFQASMLRDLAGLIPPASVAFTPNFDASSVTASAVFRREPAAPPLTAAALAAVAVSVSSTDPDCCNLTDGPRSPSTVVSAGASASDSKSAGRESVADDQLDPLADRRRSMGYDFAGARLIPDHICSHLRAGSRFSGTQQSDQQTYSVDVEIKNVDIAESTLCGYLKIKGLTPDHPTLTTFFDGEIIGPRYGFTTHHDSWGATHKTDLHHWSRFTAWRSLQQQGKKHAAGGPRPYVQQDHIFMRWKEAFLVPDHRVKTISGASFEGFYYICFNQARGSISGIYFHSKSAKHQQLELKPVETYGLCPAIEFR